MRSTEPVASEDGPTFRLLSDCGGKIREVALCIIAEYFLPEKRSKLTPLANLIQSFDPGTEIRLLVHEQSLAAANEFLSRVAHECTVIVVAAAPADRLRDIFIQDKFSVADEIRSGKRAMIRSTAAVRTGALAADWIDSGNEYRKYSCDYWPEGGNCLIGDDFWIVNSGIYLDKSTRDIAACNAFLKTREGRRLHYCGFTQVELCAEGKVTTADPDLFHLDLLASVTGVKDPDTKADIIVVGRPLDARLPAVREGLSQDWRDEHGWRYDGFSWARRAYNVKQALEADGFKVIATPMPIMGMRRFTYTNVILENFPWHRLWLPQYGDRDEWLKSYDESAVEIWRRLGFEVVKVPGWSEFLDEGGALRCATKVLRRA